MHGKSVRIYVGARDANTVLTAADVTIEAELHDRTTFADAGWKTFQGGTGGGQVELTALYDPSNDTVASLESPGAELPVSIYDGDANSIGDRGIITGAMTVSGRSQPIGIGDLGKSTVTLQGGGQIGARARLLHPLGQETATGSSDGVDLGVIAITNGGRGTLHVTAVTGSSTIRIQHSADGSVYADLIVFTVVSAITSESIEVSGTVNRYVRDNRSVTTGNVTYVSGFSPY
jgi:hypothetical protein